MFLRNCWYVAAMNDEVHRLLLMRRVILGEPVLLYRKSDGTPVALEDRCPHRHAPLSMGRLVRGDFVECAYHGLTFDGAGKCVRIPAQDTIPPSANVRAFLEDLKMIKGQQENLRLNPKAPRLNIATDSGGLLAKRIVDQMIEQERAQTKAA